jgi:hypothetical protein
MDDVIRREDVFGADLRCLMCGRLVGQLAGRVWRDASAQRTLRSTVTLTAFQAATPGAPRVPLTGRERFRCDACGGMAVMEEISVSVVRDSRPLGSACPVHTAPVHDRGRRPKGCVCRDLQGAA